MKILKNLMTLIKNWIITNVLVITNDEAFLILLFRLSLSSFEGMTAVPCISPSRHCSDVLESLTINQSINELITLNKLWSGLSKCLVRFSWLVPYWFLPDILVEITHTLEPERFKQGFSHLKEIFILPKLHKIYLT